MKTKVPRAFALDVARDILAWFKPLCARVIIAGSLRRKKAEVGDIEILYIARWMEWPDPFDIFQKPVPTNVSDHALALKLAAGDFSKRLKETGIPIGWGPDNKYAVHEISGVAVDFFRTTPECWHNALVCKTGGAVSNTRIAGAALARGWHWNPTGEGFTRSSGPDRGRIHAVKSEREVFEFAGLEFLEPQDRP